MVFPAVGLAGGGGGAVLPPAGLGGGGGGVALPAVGLGGGGGVVFPAGGLGGDLASVFGALSAFLGYYFAAGFLASLGASLVWIVFGTLLESVFASFLPSAGLAPSAGLPPSAGLFYPTTASLGFFPPFPVFISVLSGRIYVTTPAAIVFPPSLKANLEPLVIVNGKCNLAFIDKLSPGLAIFVFSGS